MNSSPYHLKSIATISQNMAKFGGIMHYSYTTVYCGIHERIASVGYSTVDSGITNLIQDPCKLSGASSGFDGWLYVPTQAWRS